MTLESIFSDKSIKSKVKVIQIAGWLAEDALSMNELLAFAENQNKVIKACCIETIEYATKKSPSIANDDVLNFVVTTLKDDAPKVKWESAKVIANIAHLYPDNLAVAIRNLIKNTRSDGKVVRWATALALGEILTLKTADNRTLLKKIEQLAEDEQENSIKKKYLNAIKKVKK